MARKIDATQGNLIKQIFKFVIPLALSTIMQNLFNLTDKAVVGQMANSTAVASVGATGTVITLVINAAIGLSTGVTVILARYIGQKKKDKVRQTIETALFASVLLGLIIAVAGYFLSPFALKAIGCPKACFENAVLYMRIYLGAAPAFLCYNYSSAALRALGDTQRPLYYIIVAGLVNISLNIVLCLILENKVLAVAIATITAKLISTILILRNLAHIEPDIRPNIRHLHFSLATFGSILRFGIPISITNLIVPLANLQIAGGINSYGVEAVAGNSAAVSLHHIAIAFASGFAIAANTFIGQNLGAQNKARVVKSFWTILWLTIAFSGSIGLLMWWVGKTFALGLIVGADATQAISYGLSRMTFTTLFTCIYAVNSYIAHVFQAFGYPMFSSASNIAFTLGFRIIWMQLIYPLNQTFDNIMLCFPVSWLLNMIVYLICFAFIYIRYVKKDIYKQIK